MNDDVLLKLHCPQCRQITEVVAEGPNLVCMECGWRFDEKIAARFLQGGVPQSVNPAPVAAGGPIDPAAS
jgi:hypothetical protein